MSNIRRDLVVLNWLNEIAKKQEWETETIKESYESTSKKYTEEHLL